MPIISSAQSVAHTQSIIHIPSVAHAQCIIHIPSVAHAQSIERRTLATHPAKNHLFHAQFP